MLLLHCQNDIVKPEGKFAFSGLPEQVKKYNLMGKWADVIKSSRYAGMSVIYLRNAFSPGFPELAGKIPPLMRGTREHGAFLKGTWGCDIPDEIKPLPDELVVDNYNTSAFSYTNMDLVLRASGIERLFLAGVATTFVVNSTARYGSELGYDIVVLEDCCAAFTDEMHDFDIKHVLPNFAEIANAKDFISALRKR